MSKGPLGPSLQYSSTPIINNVLWTADNPIDKQTQFIAVHIINKAGRAGRGSYKALNPNVTDVLCGKISRG